MNETDAEISMNMTTLCPGNAVLKCNEHDLTRKGSKKNRFHLLTILPAHFGTMKGFEGQVGYLENMNSHNPKFVVDTEEGQLIFEGRIVNSSTIFFAIDCVPSSVHSQISDVFQNVLIFDDPIIQKSTSSTSNTNIRISEEGVNRVEILKNNMMLGVDEEEQSSTFILSGEKGLVYSRGFSINSDPVHVSKSKSGKKLFHSQLSQTPSISSPSAELDLEGGDDREDGDEEVDDYDSNAEESSSKDGDMFLLASESDTSQVERGRRSTRKTTRKNYAETANDLEDHEIEVDLEKEDIISDNESLRETRGKSEYGVNLEATRSDATIPSKKPASPSKSVTSKSKVEIFKKPVYFLSDSSVLSSGIESSDEVEGESEGSTFGIDARNQSKQNVKSAPKRFVRSQRKKEKQRVAAIPEKKKDVTKVVTASAGKNVTKGLTKRKSSLSDDDEDEISSYDTEPLRSTSSIKRARRTSAAKVNYAYDSSDVEEMEAAL